MNRSVVSVATTSTVNITGLRTMTRGSSFLNASTAAGPRIFGSVSVATVRLRVWESSMGCLSGSIECAGVHGEVLGHRAE